MTTQRDRVLGMLRGAGAAGVTTAEFLTAYVPRFSARIEELRKAGHVIGRTRISNGSWRYILARDAGVPAIPANPPLASDSGHANVSLFDLPPQGPLGAYDDDQLDAA